MTLKNLIMCVRYIKLIIGIYYGLLMNKLGIKIKSENENATIIKEYYENNYDISEEDSMYHKYKIDKYDGYEVKEGSNNLVYNNKEKEKYRLINYQFGLPIHKEVINKLNIKINKDKYKLIYVLLDNQDNSVDYKELLLLNECLGLNLLFIYDSMIIDDREADIDIMCSELLFVVNVIDYKKFISELINKEVFKTYGVKVNVVEDILVFLRGDYLLEHYNLEKNIIFHLEHEVLIYNLKKDLEDFYILGNHINSIYSNNLNSYLLNLHFQENEYGIDKEKKSLREYDIAINKEKNKIYKKIRNIHLLNTFNKYVLIKRNWKDVLKIKFRNKLNDLYGGILNKIKKYKLVIILFLVIYLIIYLLNISEVSIYFMSFIKNSEYITTSINKLIPRNINKNININNNKIDYDKITSNTDFKNEIENIKKIHVEMGRIKNRMDMEMRLDKKMDLVDDVMLKNENKLKQLDEFLEYNKGHNYIGYNQESIKYLNMLNSDKQYMLNELRKLKEENLDGYNKYIEDNENNFIDFYNKLTQYTGSYKNYNIDIINKNELFQEYGITVVEHNQFYENKVDIVHKALYDHLSLKLEEGDNVTVLPLTSSEYLYLFDLIKKRKINIEITQDQLAFFINNKIKNVRLYSGQNNMSQDQYSSKLGYKYNKKEMEGMQEIFLKNKSSLPKDEQLILESEINSRCTIASHNIRCGVESKLIEESSINSLVKGASSYEDVLTEKIDGVTVETKESIMRIIKSVFNLFN